jgi:hypothetical protein
MANHRRAEPLTACPKAPRPLQLSVASDARPRITGQKETVCLNLDFEVFRSAEVSSQIATQSFSLLRISYLVGSMVRLHQITGHGLGTCYQDHHPWRWPRGVPQASGSGADAYVTKNDVGARLIETLKRIVRQEECEFLGGSGE